MPDFVGSTGFKQHLDELFDVEFTLTRKNLQKLGEKAIFFLLMKKVELMRQGKHT